jgi:hypothetical protein
MKVVSETRMGPAYAIGDRMVRVVEKRQTISSGTGVVMSILPLGILISEGGCEYYYSLQSAPEP